MAKPGVSLPPEERCGRREEPGVLARHLRTHRLGILRDDRLVHGPPPDPADHRRVPRHRFSDEGLASLHLRREHRRSVLLPEPQEGQPLESERVLVALVALALAVGRAPHVPQSYLRWGESYPRAGAVFVHGHDQRASRDEGKQDGPSIPRSREDRLGVSAELRRPVGVGEGEERHPVAPVEDRRASRDVFGTPRPEPTRGRTRNRRRARIDGRAGNPARDISRA